MMNCPICFSDQTRPVYKNSAINIERDVLLCESCDVFFVSPLPSKEELDHLYQTEWSWEYGMGEKSSIVRRIFQYIYEMHQKFIARERATHLVKNVTNPTARLLEIGSGNGAFLSEVSRYYEKVEGIEPSLKKDYSYQGVHIKKGAINSPLPEGQDYDVICMYMVLEHMPDPVQALNNLKKGLKKGGSLVVEVPFSPYKEFETMDAFELGKVFDNVHLFHFSRKNVQHLAKRLGMALEDFEVIQKMEYIKGYNVFAVYPSSSQEGLGYKLFSLFNLVVLYAKGLARLSIHSPIDELRTPFGDGFWIRFVLKN